MLQQGFIDRSGSQPQHIALMCGDQELNYAALDAQSAALAAALHNLGVRAGDRVGLYLDKSIPAIVAIFGILRCGACYVPVDVQTPPRRAALILHDCAVRLLISTRARAQRLQADLPAGGDLQQVIALDAEAETSASGLRMLPWARLLQTPVSALPAHVDKESPAYILYTSGSTGTPKGVVISHRAALGFVYWAQQTFALAATDRVISQSPLHFDLSIFDLFVTLSSGATLILPPAGLGISPAGYTQFLQQQRISVLYATPAILGALWQNGQLDQHADWALRLLLFAGDVMPPQLARGLMQHWPQTRFYNLYGPTETNVCSWYELPGPPADDSPLPIGRACGDLHLAVMNPQGQPMPVGEVGELWVQGANVMSGYWKREQQNAHALVAVDNDPARHWYRTGDRVRYDHTGNLQFLGRMDNMIKTRGYRVEPEEIEHLLLQHPQVCEAVVKPCKDERMGLLLEAVIAATEPRPDARELKRLCAQNLPDYMVPRHIVFTAQLPKTSTGKIDRKRVLAGDI